MAEAEAVTGTDGLGGNIDASVSPFAVGRPTGKMVQAAKKRPIEGLGKEKGIVGGNPVDREGTVGAPARS